MTKHTEFIVLGLTSEDAIHSWTCFSYNYVKKHCKQWSGWYTAPIHDPCTVSCSH